MHRRVSGRRWLSAAALAVSLLLISTLVAYADEVLADGDGVIPFAGQPLALGTVCAGHQITRQVLVAPARKNMGNGGYGRWVPGSTVTISVVSTTTPDIEATVPVSPGNQVTLPTNWGQLGDGIIGGTVTSTVKITPSTTGPFFGQVVYSAVGPRLVPGANLTDIGPMNVTAWVVTCPSITIGTPVAGGKYLLGSDIGADYTCSGDSAITTCAGPVADGSFINTASVGQKTFTVTATEADGGFASKTVKYRVVYPFTWIAPTVGWPTINQATAGQQIKVRFSLSGNHGSQVFNGKVGHRRVNCSTGKGLGNLLFGRIGTVTYNATTDRYVVNWHPPASWAGQCHNLVVRLSDGTNHAARHLFSSP